MPDALPPMPSALDLLMRRASVPPRLLQSPGPDDEIIRTAVAAALRAPDHGGLRPWRFVVIEGPARFAFGELLATSLARRAPDTPAGRLDLERAKPLRAPMLIVAGAALRHDRPGVPVWEQEATAAAGTMNLLNALDAMGYGSIWLSSEALRDATVKAALGFQDSDALLGFIYVGTPAVERPHPDRPSPDGFVERWNPIKAVEACPFLSARPAP